MMMMMTMKIKESYQRSLKDHEVKEYGTTTCRTCIIHDSTRRHTRINR